MTCVVHKLPVLLSKSTITFFVPKLSTLLRSANYVLANNGALKSRKIAFRGSNTSTHVFATAHRKVEMKTNFVYFSGSMDQQRSHAQQWRQLASCSSCHVYCKTTPDKLHKEQEHHYRYHCANSSQQLCHLAVSQTATTAESFEQFYKRFQSDMAARMHARLFDSAQREVEPESQPLSSCNVEKPLDLSVDSHQEHLHAKMAANVTSQNALLTAKHTPFHSQITDAAVLYQRLFSAPPISASALSPSLSSMAAAPANTAAFNVAAAAATLFSSPTLLALMCGVSGWPAPTAAAGLNSSALAAAHMGNGRLPSKTAGASNPNGGVGHDGRRRRVLEV